MMVEDRAGRGPEALQQAVAGDDGQGGGRRRASCRCSRCSRPRRRSSISTSTAPRRSSSASTCRTCSPRCRSISARPTSTTSTCSAAPSASSRRREREYRADPKDVLEHPRAQLRRRDRAARLVHDGARHLRARIACRATISIRRPSSTAPRRPATRRGRRSRSCSSSRPKRCRTASPTNGRRSPSSRSRAGNTAIFAFLLAVVFVFLVLAAQYESLTLPLAVILIVPMCLIASIIGVVLRGQDNNILTQVGFIVLIGACGQERHPDRRIRQAARGSGPRPLRGRGRGGAAAAAADPDDVARLHLRRVAAGVGDRRRRRAAPGAGHRGVFRHDRGDGVRPDLHAGVLCGHALDRGAACAAPRAQPRAAHRRNSIGDGSQ